MHFIFAITSFNRLSYLKDCLNSWDSTRDRSHQWSLLIADDGSDQEILAYLDSLAFEGVTVKCIKNNRIGVHNQMNCILKYLEKTKFDFCFKADDDIEFLNKGWDTAYYNKAIETGYHHLVFCEKTWGTEQFTNEKISKDGLESRYGILNVHGFFYTISPSMIEKVGFFDVVNFGFRGMGHVDYTARACRAGFNHLDHPFDIENSSKYLSAKKENYSGAIDDDIIRAYDNFHRTRKEKVILENRIYIPFSESTLNFSSFLSELPEVFKSEIKKKNEEIDWYKKTYEILPKWWKKIGALIRKVK